MTRFLAFTAFVLTSACSPPASDSVRQDGQTTANAAAPSGAAGSAATPGDDAAVANQAVTSENYSAVMSARARVHERLEYKPVTLTGFEAGDNSYVEIVRSVEGSPFETVLCIAPQCADWRDAGALPAALKNKEVGAKFGAADQIDGAGKVMKRNVAAIVDFRIPAALTATRSDARLLPLTRGAYVIVGDDCAQPANASIRVWNGRGLSGSATRDCRTTVRSRSGQSYRVSNSCVNTYDGSRTTEQLTLRLPTADQFVQGGATFQRCPMDQVPDWLRRLVE